MAEMSEVPGVRIATSGTLIAATASPVDAAGDTIAPRDVVGQTRAALTAALAQIDASSVLQITVLVAEHLQADLIVAQDAVAEFFPGGTPPITVAGVARLAGDDQVVSISLLAAG